MTVRRDEAAGAGVSRAGSTMSIVSMLASLAFLLAVVGAAVSGPSVGQTLIVAATVAALAALLATARRIAVRATPAVVMPHARAGEVDAPTAYWCALGAPTCPQRPRAPGRS